MTPVESSAARVEATFGKIDELIAWRMVIGTYHQGRNTMEVEPVFLLHPHRSGFGISTSQIAQMSVRDRGSAWDQTCLVLLLRLRTLQYM